MRCCLTGDIPHNFRRSGAKLESGSANVGHVTMNTHTGTHMDAPFHFDNQGRTAAELVPDVYIELTLVVHLPNIEKHPAILDDRDRLPGISQIISSNQCLARFRLLPFSYPHRGSRIGPVSGITRR